jgi:hypothetical protein
MSPKRVQDLLDRVRGVGDPCDLDLLLFFYRHPRAVLTSERLAVYVGYELSRVAKSLDTLIAAGLLTRVQRPTASARMYLLTDGGRSGGWLEALLRLASTREGRLAALAALARRQSAIDSSNPGGSEPPVARARHQRPDARTRELRHA